MEKTNNGYYKAVSILSFIVAALSLISTAFMLIIVFSGADVIDQIMQALIEQSGGTTAEWEAIAQMMYTFIVLTAVVAFAETIILFIQGAKFKKYSYQTDEEAANNFGKCIAWVVVSFMFSGLLIFGLSLAGLLTVQRKQKERFANGDKTIKSNATSSNTNVSTVSLDAMYHRLSKLKELKDSGAINDEEFNKMRAEIVGDNFNSKAVDDKEVDRLNKINERLTKLNELKASGVVTEEEYNTLRNQILQQDK